MLLLACSAGYVAYVDYLSRGLQPLFVALLLGVTSWAGYFLWEDPGAGGAAPPDRGEGPDGDAATTARAGATRTAAGGARVREKVAADIE